MTMGMRAPRSRLLAALPGGVALLALAACAGSGKGLIPSANAGPLRSDFENVVQAAEAGGGVCTGTEAALLKTDRDYEALGAGVDAGLRSRLGEGIAKLRVEALVLCAQPHPQATVTSTTTKSTAPTRTTTTPTVTQTTSTVTTPTTATPPAPTEGGGTAAPGTGEPVPGGEQGAGGSSPGSGQPGGPEGAGGPGAGNGSAGSEK